jgi:hypothetical protein
VSEDPNHEDPSTGKRNQESFGLFLVISFGGNAVAMATLVALAAAILDLPVSRIWIPYAVLLIPGLVLAPYLYWARLTRDRPQACAFRFTIGLFSYLIVLSAALIFGAVWVGVLSLATAEKYMFPSLVPIYLVLSLPFYALALKMLKDMQRAQSTKEA